LGRRRIDVGQPASGCNITIGYAETMLRHVLPNALLVSVAILRLVEGWIAASIDMDVMRAPVGMRPAPVTAGRPMGSTKEKRDR
jgi:hypothetical protein